MKRIAAKTQSNSKFTLTRMTREYLRPKKASQQIQTEIQNVEHGLMQLPKGKTLDDLRPPKKTAQCQANPEMKNREIQVEQKAHRAQSARISVEEEMQTDLVMEHVYTKEEVDAIREATVERNVVYNQEKGSSGVESPTEPASALGPVADVRKKRNPKKKTPAGRRFTVVAPEVNDLENYFDANKVLHIQEQSLDIQEEADPEKEMIQKKIQENIKKALKSHAAKKMPYEKRQDVDAP